MSSLKYEGVIDYILKTEVRGWFKPVSEHISFVLKYGDSSEKELPYILGDSHAGRLSFELFIPSDLDGFDIATGLVSIIINASGGKFILPIWTPLRLAYILSKLNANQISAISKWNKLLTSSKPQLLDDSFTKTEVGSESKNNEAVLGRNGFFFLSGGTNKVSDLYVNSFFDKKIKWEELILKRSEQLIDREVKFIQIIIPEKSSVLSIYCPFYSTKPSQLLAEIYLHNSGNENLYIPFLDDEFDEYYLRSDSHLSNKGAELMISRLLSKYIGSNLNWTVNHGHFLLKGDLGSKFLVDYDELVDVYTELHLDGVLLEPVLIFSYENPAGGHIGMTRIWKCDSAPIKLKVVAFSNSFFERGAISTQLSWWFSRLFSEFHFIWSPELKIDYVDNVKPDIVICQTIERFLRVVPES